MPSRFTRIVAAFLIVLGVSPFTAPFSTCDLRALIGDQHHHDPSEGGSMVKAPADPDEAPAVAAAAAALTSPLFSLVPHAPAPGASRRSSQRISRQVLRI